MKINKQNVEKESDETNRLTATKSQNKGKFCERRNNLDPILHIFFLLFEMNKKKVCTGYFGRERTLEKRFIELE